MNDVRCPYCGNQLAQAPPQVDVQLERARHSRAAVLVVKCRRCAARGGSVYWQVRTSTRRAEIKRTS